MGRRGPSPTPSRLQELRGNPGKRAINRHEPKPAIGAVCPSWLSKLAKIEWKRIAPELERLGLLTMVDQTALASYCQAHAELIEATKRLDKDGRIIDIPVYNKTGEEVGSIQKQHPAVKLQRDAFTRVKQFLAEFGLTPASRARLQVDNAEEKTDPFEAFLRGSAVQN